MRLISLALGIGTGIIVFPAVFLSKRRSLCKAEATVPSARIAIVGAGIGGSSSAHLTREFFGSAAVIDVYEASNRIGGRLDTVEVAGKTYEAGGSIIHSDNKHMQDFVKFLDLKKIEKSESSDLLGIYNGTDFAFLGSRWKALNYAKLIWRYGYDLVRMESFVSKTLKKFNRIYGLQKDGKCFKTVTELLSAMGGDDFIALTKKSLRDELRSIGMRDRTIDELVTLITRINYGQDSTLNAFAGAVALAGTGGSLWAVEGGNWRVCEGLLEQSKASIYKETKIKEIEKDGSNTYILTTDKGTKKYYDVVIIAAPLDIDSYYLSCPKCNNWPGPRALGTFWQTIATFFSAEINYKHFGFSTIGEAPEIIGTTANPANFFNSIGAQHSVVKDESSGKIQVRKVFSRQLLTDEQKVELFPNWREEDCMTKSWLAYPNLKPANHFSSFILDDGVFYLNAIEHAASAMEMSAVSAKNAALLAFQYVSKKQAGDEQIGSTAGGSLKAEL